MKTRRNWIWFFIKLIPLVVMVSVCVMFIQNVHSANTSIDVSILTSQLSAVSNSFSFKPITNAFINIYYQFDSTATIDNYAITQFVIRYISYLVLIEIFRIMYEVLVFLPKFANSFFERKLGD